MLTDYSYRDNKHMKFNLGDTLTNYNIPIIYENLNC